jgi:hypothetical protein
MSDNITGSMVGESANANAKASAAKTIANKVGMLLDVRGFMVTKQEPYSSDTRYGAKFTIEHECKLTDGREIEAMYLPGDDTFFILFSFPQFKDIDGDAISLGDGHYRMDYFNDGTFCAKDSKNTCEKLLEVWDDTVMKNIVKGRRYLRASDNPSPITDVTKGVKYIEGVWDQYTRMFRVHKAKANLMESEAKKMKGYISGMEKVFKGSHTHSQTYGDKVSRSYKTDNLGEIMVQMDYDSNGSVGLDSVTVPKGRATAFLKHMLRWKG